MRMQYINRILSGISFCLAFLLAFLLLFEAKLAVPGLFQSVGRLHVLSLHLPIGMLVLISILILVKKKSFNPSFTDVLETSVLITSFFAFCTALFGLVLSKESGYDNELVDFHKWWGIATAYIIYFLSLLSTEKTLFKIGLAASVLTLIVGSHLGATITHGEGYLKGTAESQDKEYLFDENASLFQNAIYPIFDAKCVSCHNPKKRKGDLDLTTPASILKGGKKGLAIDNENLQSSRLLEYIHLPEEDKKHMPPAGKPQLKTEEIQVLNQWIKSGADFTKKWNEYADEDSLKSTATKLIKKPDLITYDFEPANPKLIESLNDPFCTITALDINSPALKASFFIRAGYQPSKLKELQKIKSQLVELNLSNMPVTDDEIKNIVAFTNLRKLILNNSLITDKAITDLSKMPNLRSLALSGTKITKASIPALNQSKSLSEVFIWNTDIGITDLDSTSAIQYYLGYQTDNNEVQKLNIPSILNASTVLDKNDSVRLYHRIPGTIIRYTVNDSIPDSTSAPIFKQPLAISHHVNVNARAVKEGWLASNVASYSFFQKGISPVSTSLLTMPNAKYRGEGAELLTNNIKGAIGNLIDGNWLGFRENHMEAMFEFDGNTTIKEVLISINKSVNSYLVPPVSVELFAGNDTLQLKSIKKIIPPALVESDLKANKNETISISLDGIKNKYIKIKAVNNPKLPKWHRGKGEKGWLFIDEIFFY